MCSPLRLLMLGFKTLASPPNLAIPIPRRCFSLQIYPNRLSIPIQSHNPRKFLVYAAEQRNGNGNGLSESDGNGNSNRKSNGNVDSGDDDELKGKNGRPGLRWGQLLLDPDPDNILSVGLTGLLTWASVQVVWQLVVVSLAIIVAALKYSVVAALLIFILIALL